MLVARGSRQLGVASLSWTLTFTAKLWCVVIERRGLVYDTRFVPGAAPSARDGASLYLCRSGTVELAGGPRLDAPSCLVMKEEHLEGAGGERTVTFRASGEPFVSIQVFVPLAHIIAKPSSLPCVATLSSERTVNYLIYLQSTGELIGQVSSVTPSLASNPSPGGCVAGGGTSEEPASYRVCE